MASERAVLAAASRDSYQALRRVERQQRIIERLHAAGGRRVELADLAAGVRCSPRTLSRDVERLRDSGVPIVSHRGRGGRVALRPTGPLPSITFDLPELAAVMSSLAVLGPSVSDSSAAAMSKLVAALQAGEPVDRSS